jgi:hypothetical protein
MMRPQAEGEPTMSARVSRAANWRASALAAAALAFLSACQTRSTWNEKQVLAALSASASPQRAATEPLSARHRGPPVADGETGTSRFAGALHAAFDEARAMEMLRFVDGHYRAPGNDGYEAVLGHLRERLAAAGFGTDPRLELLTLESELLAPHWGKAGRHPSRAWTPLAGELTLLAPGKEPRRLHGFDAPAHVDRVMLPINVDEFSVRGKVALDLESLTPGDVLVCAATPDRALLSRAHAAGAVAVVSGYLESYNSDPTGAERHLDAIHFHQIAAGAPIPVVMISPRSHQLIEQACAGGQPCELVASAKVRWDERPLRTLVAIVKGTDRPQEAISVASHVQEPGACDNASGVAGLAESAIGLAGLLRGEQLEWPSRSLVFLWGDEFRQTSAWLDSARLTTVAGLSSDMTGESQERTGAIALLERMPDPAALVFLPPDEHTPWGKRDVSPDSLVPNGLAVIARCAMLDVSAATGGNWVTAEHPYEGGSDHDIFIERGLPSALIWHFTDFTYHTSLDRVSYVDAAEMRRTAAVILATALALADPRSTDLDRYLRSLDLERDLRVKAAEAAGDPELAGRWRQWCDGAREWLRVECLRIPPEQR